MPNEFFTATTMLTLLGGSSAVLVVGNTFQSLTKKDPKWLAFAMSLALCFAGAIVAAGQRTPPEDAHFRLIDGLVALINGCLLFCTASGVNSASGQQRTGTVTQGTKSAEGSVSHVPVPGTRGWNTRWF